MIAMRRYRLDSPFSVLALLLLLALPGGAAGQPATPRLEGRVTDLAKVFSAEQRQRLTEELAAHEDGTSQQIAVLTVPTLSGESIEAFSRRVANSWGLGQKGKDNGILVTLALQEHGVRIELGRGLESKIPQETLDGIIQNDMIPAFRKDDYAGGLEKGVRHLIEEAAPRSAGSLDCDVDVRVNRIEKKTKVTAELAKELDLGKEAVGRLGLAALDATAVAAKASPGKKDTGCADLIGHQGRLVLHYELSDPRAGKLVPGQVVRLHFTALAGFAPYGVPGTEIWTLPPK